MGQVGCLDDETLLELVSGTLPAAALADVDAHLDTCGDCREIVAGVARADGAAGGGEPEIRPGATVGRFVVLELVGGGAMGLVYSAYDPQLDRRVALKLLRADTRGERGRARLLREAQAMARLSDPNVVTVYDVGTLGDRVFVAMELVAGDTIRDWLATAARSPDEIRDVFAQAGRGLAAAHEAGLVHRDFKPDNVIVGPDGRARVTDFGLARGVGGEEDGDGAAVDDDAPLDRPALTRTGAILGTPAYMSPEQLDGHTADARSDQFAFCVALFEALEGRRPFEADTFGELVAAVKAGRVRSGDRRGPRRLHELALRGLRPDPAQRFESMRALVAELDDPSPDLRRRRLALAATLAPLVAVAVWAALPGEAAPAPCAGAEDEIASAWDARRAAQVRAAFARLGPSGGAAAADAVVGGLDRWSSGWVAAHRDTCEATHVRNEQSETLLDARMACLAGARDELAALGATLVHVDAVTAGVARDAVAALPDVTRCEDVRSLTAVEPPARADVDAVAALRRRMARGRALVATARWTEASPLADAAVRDAEAIDYPPVVAEARLLRARVARGVGALDAAEEDAQATLDVAVPARVDETAAWAWLELVAGAGERGRVAVAAERARHAGAAVERVGSPPRLLAELVSHRGLVHLAAGRHDDAGADLERALELRRRADPGAPRVAVSLTNLGNLARARGDLDEALRRHREAMALDQAALGAAHPALARHLHNVAGVLRLQGRPEEALDHYRRALAMKVEALGDGHAEVGLTHNSLGLVSVDLGRLAEARTHYERALRILGARGHADEATALANLGRLDLLEDDPAAAVERLREAIERGVAAYGPDDDRLARWRADHAEARARLADRGRAPTRARGGAAPGPGPLPAPSALPSALAAPTHRAPPGDRPPPAASGTPSPRRPPPSPPASGSYVPHHSW